jgi:hypothetical protein
MDILKALKGEESKLFKKAQAIRAAIDILDGNSSRVEGNERRKKRHVSAAVKARISKAQKARWAAKRKAEK